VKAVTRDSRRCAAASLVFLRTNVRESIPSSLNLPQTCFGFGARAGNASQNNGTRMQSGEFVAYVATRALRTQLLVTVLNVT